MGPQPPPPTHPHSPALHTPLCTLITALHILHHHAVLDAYGHLSLRSPQTPTEFLMPRNLAPALVATAADIVAYRVSNGEPVLGAAAPAGYLERYIHSEIYRRWPGVNAVVHSHDPQLVPWGLLRLPAPSGVGTGQRDGKNKEGGDGPHGLRAVMHMAGFLGTRVPVWDIAGEYAARSPPTTVQDMLVTDVGFGASLAEALGSEPASTSASSATFPPHRVILMRGHGYTAVAEDVQLCVFMAVYAQVNARMQAQALAVSRALGVAYTCLSEDEAAGAWVFNRRTAGRPWGLWVEEVKACGRYKNELDAGYNKG